MESKCYYNFIFNYSIVNNSLSLGLKYGDFHNYIYILFLYLKIIIIIVFRNFSFKHMPTRIRMTILYTFYLIFIIYNDLKRLLILYIFNE